MNEPIRVLMIGMHNKIGGVETYIMNYYRNINRDKVQFDFISVFDKLCFQDEILQLGGKIYKVPNFKKSPLRYCMQLKKIIKEGNYNIVHVNMLSAANILPIWVAKKCKVQNIIAHSHNSGIPMSFIKRTLDKINKNILLKNATTFFACSELAGRWMFGDKTKFTVIHNAVELEKYKYNEETRDNIRKDLNVENKFVIGHVGRFCYQKNHEFLLDIFNEVQKQEPEAVLLLIGEGELEEVIREKVEKLGISDKVIFLGTTDKVQDYLQAMDIFVLPSRFEGLPVVGVEAQASGTKCIFSKNITQELKITEDAKFIGLEERVDIWASEILEYKSNRKTEIEYDSLVKKYNIKEAGGNLTNIYLKIYENINKQI